VALRKRTSVHKPASNVSEAAQTARRLPPSRRSLPATGAVRTRDWVGDMALARCNGRKIALMTDLAYVPKLGATTHDCVRVNRAWWSPGAAQSWLALLGTGVD